ETFARAFEHRASLGPDDPAALRGWLFTVARRLLIDDGRRAVIDRSATERLGIRRRPLDDAEYDRIERLAATAEMRRQVAAGLAALPDDQRTALQMRIVDETPYVAIARTLGVTEQVVRARVSRGLRALRHHLAPQESLDHA
ncbi:MAG: RNA polymerase sigma factor, partial [Solirubrobacteraceae bacterium]